MLEDAIIEGALSWGQDGDIRPSGPDAYTWPVLDQTLAAHPWRDKRAIDLGCGNGVNVNRLAPMGFQACGVELSHSGTAAANRMFPDLNIRQGSIYDDLAGQIGTFPLVIRLEMAGALHDATPRRPLAVFQAAGLVGQLLR